LALARGLPNADDVIPNLLGNRGVFEMTQGNRNEAREAYEAQLDLLEKQGLSFSQPLVLGNLATLAREEGDYQQSAQWLREALFLGLTVRNSFVIAGILEDVATHALAASNPRAAARFLGAADALRRSAGVAVEPQNVEKHEDLVKQARDELGEMAFCKEWNDGEAWSLEEACSEAIRELDELMERM
jgi:tetratricopeptide (TPR) repeat protein